jgi:hypothetical protein
LQAIQPQRKLQDMTRPALLLIALSIASSSSAQQTDGPPPSIQSRPGPAKSHPKASAQKPSFLDNDTYLGAIFAGGGISSDGTLRPAGAQFGASGGTQTLGKNPGDVGFLQFIETGAIGPLANRNSPAAFIGYDLGVNFLLSRNTHTVPFVAGGYSYLFGEASALNIGAGADYYYAGQRAIRLEVRDYFTFTAVPQNNVSLRIAWVFSVHNP